MYHKTGPHAKLYKKSCNNRFVLICLAWKWRKWKSWFWAESVSSGAAHLCCCCLKAFWLAQPRMNAGAVRRHQTSSQSPCINNSGVERSRHLLACVQAWLWFSCQPQWRFIGVWRASLTVRQRSPTSDCSRWTRRGCLHACILSTSP